MLSFFAFYVDVGGDAFWTSLSSQLWMAKLERKAFPRGGTILCRCRTVDILCQDRELYTLTSQVQNSVENDACELKKSDVPDRFRFEKKDPSDRIPEGSSESNARSSLRSTNLL